MKDLVDILGHYYIADYGYPFDPYLWVYVVKSDKRGFMLMGSDVIGIRT